MPINTNITEDQDRVSSPKSSNIKVEDDRGNNITEVDKIASSTAKNKVNIAVRDPATEKCPQPSSSSQVKKSNSKLPADSKNRTKKSVVSGDMALQQQVSEKLKSLSERLKITRNQHYNSELIMKQQPSSSPSTNSKPVASEGARDARDSRDSRDNRNNIRNETTSKPRSTPPVLSVKKAVTTMRKEAEIKTRQQLEAEVCALRKLLDQLSLEHPELCPRIASIAESMPELKQMNVVKQQRLEGGLDDFDGQRPSTSRGCSSNSKLYKRPLFESAGQMSTDATMEENELGENRSRKRGKRGDRKRKNSIKQKNQVSEMRDLVKYVNNIVEEYLSKNEAFAATVRNNLQKFEGGFDDLDPYAMHLVELGLGRIVEDELRVNRKNNRQSFVTMSTDRETLERDGMVMLPVARRYAFEGDIVRAFVLNASSSSDNGNDKNTEKSKVTIRDSEENCMDDDVLYDGSESPDSDLDSNELLDTTGPTLALNCPKAFVVEVLKHTDDRTAVGSISFKHTTQLSGDNGRYYYKFRPLDTRMPLMYVPDVVGAAHARSAKAFNEVTDLLYLAQVCQTDINGHCIAELLEKLGKVGHLEHELKAILLHNGLKDIKPYEQRFEDLYADPSIPPITNEMLKQREDLRLKCIFTIDPPTARDLDDALSIDIISDDVYEVGVHIADVSYFLEEGSELDDIVKSRATSIYLVNEVIHMLPVSLCYKCSLIPGEDKFAFSVFWHMNKFGDVLGSPRFTRSIINSCTKFAYGHAQKFIENSDTHVNADDFPDIYNGYTLPMISERVKMLREIARNMRHNRFENGALSINNPKLRFDLDPTTGEPLSYEIDRQQEANHLIEEFMLLANMTVAKHIYENFPDISLLRNHAPPLMTSVKNLQEKLSNLGLNLDCSSSKAIYSSMQRICNEAEDPIAMNACLSTLLTKPMARAKYICSEGKTSADLWHYALSIPIYTHFTSPIRRYPDILVHRLLAATLGYCSKPQRTPEELSKMATVCNAQKFNAKAAGDESILLYFKRYVKAKQGITLRAAVLEIHKHLVNVVTVQTGHVIPIQYKAQKVIVDTSNVPTSIQISEKGSQKPPVKLQMFSSVDIKLVIRDEKLVAFFVSPDLKQRQINCIEMTKNNIGQKKNCGKNAQQLQSRQEHRLNALRQQQKQENTDRPMESQQTNQQNTIISEIFRSTQRTKKSQEQQKH